MLNNYTHKIQSCQIKTVPRPRWLLTPAGNFTCCWYGIYEGAFSNSGNQGNR